MDAHGIVDFKAAEFRGKTKFADTIFRGSRTSFEDVRFGSERDFSNVKVRLDARVVLPDGYTVDPIGREFGLVRDGSAGT